MKKFFYPESVAVIGVSESPSNMGRMIVHNLINKGFTGPIHAVGPKGGTVFGRPIHRHVADIETPPDMAALFLPPPLLPRRVCACRDGAPCRDPFPSAGSLGRFDALQEQ